MSEPEFPRYFRYRDGFSDGTLFVKICENGRWATVHPGGEIRQRVGDLPLNSILRRVAHGEWIEVPRREAEAAIRKARGEE